MNILFLTLLDFHSIYEHNIYTDLLREFTKHGHFVYAISPVEEKNCKESKIIEEEKIKILKLKIGNIKKVNIIKKGISTITLESIFIKGIKKYFYNIQFDLILYSTPPITFQRAVNYVKKRDEASTYLLLKDIFPQNDIDIGMLNKSGFNKFIYLYFRKKEKKLYKVSEHIGCMSEANKNYIIKHNPEISPDTVEICPNSIEVMDMRIHQDEKNKIRKKYNIPLEQKVLIYGGNLGKPQGIPFLIQCLKSQLNNPNAFFLIIGDGTEFKNIKLFFEKFKPSNMKLCQKLPQKDYDKLVSACDVGMVFLDYRFTIPNFPSRILSYMQAGLPILAVTDRNTDLGKIIVDNDLGWWCESNNAKRFYKLVNDICSSETIKKGNKNYSYLTENYNVNNTYEIIINNFIAKI